MPGEKPLNIPVILGTTRVGRTSAHVARFVTGELEKRAGVVTELIDIKELPLPVTSAGEDIKDPGFSKKMEESDALVIVAPEYNHSFPGLLKHVLDTCLEEYIHKAAGVVGVSSGPFGGTRVVQNLIPVLRELGLMTIFSDLNFSNARKAFDEKGNLLEEVWVRRAGIFFDELVWMATVLRYGRENVPQE
ncbi:MAG: NADPH-dependent FMN reductase [Vicinamibacteria bacterium]